MLQLTHAVAAAMNPSSPPTPVRPRISALHSPSDSQMATYAAFLAHSKKSTDRGFFRTFIAGKRTVERSAAPQQPMRARWNRKWGRAEKVCGALRIALAFFCALVLVKAALTLPRHGDGACRSNSVPCLQRREILQAASDRCNSCDRTQSRRRKEVEVMRKGALRKRAVPPVLRQ
jgi:hypothetical protein